MSYLNFKGVNDYGDFTITDELQYGLQTYFEWGFLNIGAFTNVRRTLYGGTNTKYKVVLARTPQAGSGYISIDGSGLWFDGSHIGSQTLQTVLSGAFGNNFPLVTYSGSRVIDFNFSNGNAGQNVTMTMTQSNDFPLRTNNDTVYQSFTDGDAGNPSIIYITIPLNSMITNLNWYQTGYVTFTAALGTILFNDESNPYSNFPGSFVYGGTTWIASIVSNGIGIADQLIYTSNTNGSFSYPGIADSSCGYRADTKYSNISNTTIFSVTKNQTGGLPDSDSYYEPASILRPVPNPNYTTARVWEGFRNNWVWESGITYQVQPIEISGIYVNNTFQPTTGVGAYEFSIDYPNGRVIFDSAIPATSTVLCEYSYKRIKLTNSDSVEGRQLHERTLDIDNQFMIYSGEKVEFDRNKLQLPVVAIEAIPRKRFPRGTQLGGGHYLEQPFLFHVFAETPQERNKILDIIVNQHDSSIVVYDMNKLAEDNMFPTNLDGNIVNQSTRNYNNLVGVGSQYGYRQGIFKSIESQEQNILASNLFGGIAKVVVEVGIPNV